MKRLAETLTKPFDTSGMFHLLEGLERNQRRLRILIYHRVAELDDDPDLEPGLISATPAAFRAEMQLLADRYRPIGLDALLDAHRHGTSLPERAVLVTFDDGYLDFAANAWPVLKALGIPVVLFVPTAFPGGEAQGFWWDRLYAALLRSTDSLVHVDPIGPLPLADAEQKRLAYRRLRNHVKSMPHQQAMEWVDGVVEQLADLPPLNRVLGWPALRELAADGVSVCSHSCSHALLTRLDGKDLEAELSQSRERLNEELGPFAQPPVLAYPANAANSHVRSATRDAGYELAFGGRRGLNRLPLESPYALQRLPIIRYQRSLFRAQLRPSVCLAGGAFTTLREKLRA